MGTAPSAAHTAPADAATDFRVRLLGGLAASIATRGYRDTTVADIVRNAKTSKRTFYDRFGTKEECFIELLRTNNEALIARIRGNVDPDAEWDAQIRCAVEAYVAHIDSNRPITLSWIREAPALGATALRLHRLAMEHLTAMVVDITGNPGFQRAGLPAVSPALALILLGGLRELTALIVEDERDIDELMAPAVAAATALMSGPSTQHQTR
ncbi:MAG: helix-turn-helix domain-containing protein [Mycobacterium sp.]